MAKRVENGGSGGVLKSNGSRNNNNSAVSAAGGGRSGSNSGSLVDLVRHYLFLFDGDEAELGTPVRLLLPDKKLGFGGTLVVALLKAISLAYDVVTWFGYYWFQKKSPREKVLLHTEIKAEVVSRGEGSCTWRSDREVRDIHVELEKGKIDTMHKVYTHAIRKNGLKRCLGTRELFKEEDEIQENGKVFKKYEMGEYHWKSYAEVDRLSACFAAGLTTLNLQRKEKICIFAETRAEWLIAAVGAFKHTFTIVTLYATLGEDAVVHGLNETESTVVLTSDELMPKFKSILKQTPHVKHLIYMEHPLKKLDTSGYLDSVSIHSFCDVIERGSKLSIRLEAPEPDDVAIIMYTSGSTGVPKGVLQSHKNVATAMLGLTDGLGPVYSDDIYVAYLPLAHVLELTCESICFLQGIPIGYSSPLTLTNNSSKIKAGSKGDAVVLEPTIMVAVPFALDRIYKMVQEQVNQGGFIKQALFYFAYDYKLWWYYKGYNTPLVDAIVMKKPKMAVGGKVRIMISGGAPLATDTHEFIRNCLCLPVVQGYGLTETCATATCSTPGDMSVGRVGPPLRCNDLRLVDWDEGNYTVNDVPLPRGELVIGGDNVAMGYFKLPEATAQDFFVADGRRWFRTGDIAVADPDGCFRIIDRKKDLVKLQMGEYLSMGKIESILKTCKYIENVCIYGDAFKNVCVALVVPAQKHLELLSSSIGKPNLSLEEMCSDPQVEAAFLKEIQSFSTAAKLHRFEIPAALKLCSELWTPDNNLVTAAFKLRRRNVQEWYQGDLDRMYAKLSSS